MGRGVDFKIMQAGASGDLSFCVGEQTVVTRPSNGGPPKQALVRVTEIYRREGDAVEMIHHQSDMIGEALLSS